MVAESEKQYLLRVARSSLESAVRNIPSLAASAIPSLLEVVRGAFVTLRIGQELRGCIGYIDAIHPLIETIRDAAARAALEDPRFPPVISEELKNVWIEISILSDRKQITRIDEIEVGTHGLLIESGQFRGLLLPQIALEQGWDREEFLDQTARKAGLPTSSWRTNHVTIFTFTAEVFSERTISPHG